MDRRGKQRGNNKEERVLWKMHSIFARLGGQTIRSHPMVHQAGKNGCDKITKVPSFKLAPEKHTKSYSTLPLAVILNGALMVPGRGRFWALLAPKEQKVYDSLVGTIDASLNT